MSHSFRFAVAGEPETLVFGAARPGYSAPQVEHWLAFMQQQQIRRVCCLLEQRQLNRYQNLLGSYQQCFGVAQVCWAPVPDFQLVDRSVLCDQILPFLLTAVELQEKVVVHCSGGVGRTGQVMAAWLVYRYGLTNQAAIARVRRSGRNPYEAALFAPLKGRNPWQIVAQFHALLDDCRGRG